MQFVVYFPTQFAVEL